MDSAGMEISDGVGRCRICQQAGMYELNEIKFRCHGADVLLIDAFNAFSTLQNDAEKIYLCEACTESLTLAYVFWQQIKLSDEKFISDRNTALLKSEIDLNERIDDQSNEEYLEDVVCIDDHNGQTNKVDIIDCDLNEGDVKEEKTTPKKKLTKTQLKRKDLGKSKKCSHNIGTNVGLPHFIVTSDDTGQQNDDERLSPLHSIGDAIEEDNGHTSSDHTSKRNKKVKTLTASAVITQDLETINQMCTVPLEIDEDDQSIFQCQHCQKAFAAPYHLIVHMRKSHLCQYCLATFIKITELYKHVKEKHTVFNCLLCEKEFQSNGNLRQHMRKNHSIALPAHMSLINVNDIQTNNIITNLF